MHAYAVWPTVSTRDTRCVSLCPGAYGSLHPGLWLHSTRILASPGTGCRDPMVVWHVVLSTIPDSFGVLGLGIRTYGVMRTVGHAWPRTLLRPYGSMSIHLLNPSRRSPDLVHLGISPDPLILGSMDPGLGLSVSCLPLVRSAVLCLASWRPTPVHAAPYRPPLALGTHVVYLCAPGSMDLSTLV